MGRTCDCTFNRLALLASDIAACFYCVKEFSPEESVEWCDGDDFSSQTAICPYCGVDSVVGFNGSVDSNWIKTRNKACFG